MPVRITNIDINKLVDGYARGLSATTLAKQFDIGRSTVLNRLRGVGIKVRRCSEWAEKRINIKESDWPEFMAFIDGILLGDGCLSKYGKLSVEQSPVRLGWLEAIQQKLREFGGDARIINICRKPKKIKGKQIGEWQGYLLYTPCFQELKPQRARWYPNDIKHVPDDVIISAVSVGEWVCGDGGGNPEGGFAFATHGFLYDEVWFLAKLLNEKFKFRATVSADGVLILNRKDDVLRLRNLVTIPECCAYKFRFARPAERKGKLAEADIHLIRKQYNEGLALAVIANQYGLSRSTISNIGTLKFYRWIPEK